MPIAVSWSLLLPQEPDKAAHPAPDLSFRRRRRTEASLTGYSDAD